jgi:hypothetical protein
VFPDCQFLQSICVPSLVDTIDGSAFSGSGIREIRVADGNRHFRVSENCLVSFDRQVPVHYLGRDRRIRVPRAIEVISKHAVALHRDISNIECESESGLRRIEAHAFGDGSFLHSLCILSFVDTIDGSAIREIRVAEGNRHFRVSGEFLLTTDGPPLVRYFGRDWAVAILSDITVVSRFSLSSSLIRTLSFEGGSQLRRIDSKAFAASPVLALCIPPFVDTIDGSAFVNPEIRELTVAEGNHNFCVSGDFLLNFEATSLIRYFGRHYGVTISREIEVVSVVAFHSCDRVRILEFESRSRIRSIGRAAFEECSTLHSVSLPPSIEVLCGSSFRKCHRLQTIRFESDSKLTTIEDGAFKECLWLRSVFLPMSKKPDGAVDLSGLGNLDLVWHEPE